jgi:hypothetical protein
VRRVSSTQGNIPDGFFFLWVYRIVAFSKPLPISGRHLHWDSSDAEDDEDDDEDEELSSGGGAWHQQIQGTTGTSKLIENVV